MEPLAKRRNPDGLFTLNYRFAGDKKLWMMLMANYLSSRGLFVNCKIDPVDHDLRSNFSQQLKSVEADQFSRLKEDELTKSIIFRHCDEETLRHFIGLNSAKEVWQCIEGLNSSSLCSS